MTDRRARLLMEKVVDFLERRGFGHVYLAACYKARDGTDTLCSTSCRCVKWLSLVSESAADDARTIEQQIGLN